MFFSWKINRQRNVKHLLLRIIDILKTCGKSKFLGKKIWRNAIALKSKKVQGVFEEKFVPFVYKILSQIFFNLFYWGDKRIYQSFLGNEVDFREIMNVSPNILAKYWNFKKLRNGFVDERVTDNKDINIFLSLENPSTFSLAKEKT